MIRYTTALLLTLALTGTASAASVAEVIDGLLIQHERDIAVRSTAAFQVAHERQTYAMDLDQAYLDLGDAYQRLERLAHDQVTLTEEFNTLRTEHARMAADSTSSPRMRRDLVALHEHIQKLRQHVQALSRAVGQPAAAGEAAPLPSDTAVAAPPAKITPAQ